MGQKFASDRVSALSSLPGADGPIRPAAGSVEQVAGEGSVFVWVGEIGAERPGEVEFGVIRETEVPPSILAHTACYQDVSVASQRSC